MASVAGAARQLAAAADGDRFAGVVERARPAAPPPARRPVTAPAAIPATARPVPRRHRRRRCCRHPRARSEPLGRVVGVGEVGGRRRHPAVAVAGQAPAAPRRHEHALVADHPGQAGPRRASPARRRPMAHPTGAPGRRRRRAPRRAPARSSTTPADTSPDVIHASSCQRTRSTIAGADIPARPVPRPLGALAVLGLGGHDEAGAHPALGGQRGDELVGEVLADEHQRLELDDRIVEGLLDAPLGWRLGARRRDGRRARSARRWAWRPGGPKRARTSPAGSAARSPRRARPMRANSPTSSGSTSPRRCSHADRQRGEEGRAGAGGDDDRGPAGAASGDAGGEAPVGDADPAR